mmetsp:Transcript_38303/g.83235  ORF Transcript_38303/g.83235 Transcript_38303/m.83235 type:complete len:620 (-) Transcript_38303:24-1883(-)
MEQVLPMSADNGADSPTEDDIRAVMEVLPDGPDMRSTAISLLERSSVSSSSGDDPVSAALNLFFSGNSTGGAPSAAATIPSTRIAEASSSIAPPASVAVTPGSRSPAYASPWQSSLRKDTTSSSSIAHHMNHHSDIGGGKVNSGSKRPRLTSSTATCGGTSQQTNVPKQSSKKVSIGPLAERVRPTTLGDLVGQTAFTTDSSLGVLLSEDRFPSAVLYGPPGCGKTTIANIIARNTQRKVVRLSATQAGVKEVRSIVEEATKRRQLNPSAGTLLFLDEVHRWNKAQQDALLPHVESGLITLLGATTENPSFSLNKALLSRCRVVTIDGLDTDALVQILKAAIANPSSGLPTNVQVSDDVLKGLAAVADGDARQVLNALELAVDMSKPPTGTSGSGAVTPIIISASTIEKAMQRTHLMYDRDGEEHYNIISALHKSMRGGDVDASLYWLARMLEAGEDARYIARRLVRFAAEDVGLADPNALLQATAAHRAAEKVGMPECDVVVAQAVVYLARAPKSVAVYSALKAAKDLVRRGPAGPVPVHIRNAPTGLMKDLDYGKGYTYNPEHGYRRGCAEGLSFFPDRLKGTRLFSEGDVESGHHLYPLQQVASTKKAAKDQNKIK